MISLFVAMDKNRAIGKNGKLPWYLPADLAYFKKMTLGHPIIMGRKTFESIGQALPRRTNIVVTRNPDWLTQRQINWPGTTISRVGNLEKAISLALTSDGNEEIFIIGGGEIFKEGIALADKLYVTEVMTEVSGADAFFPEIPYQAWQARSRDLFSRDGHNLFDYDFVVYDRKVKAQSHEK